MSSFLILHWSDISKCPGKINSAYTAQRHHLLCVGDSNGRRDQWELSFFLSFEQYLISHLRNAAIHTRAQRIVKTKEDRSIHTLYVPRPI